MSKNAMITAIREAISRELEIDLASLEDDKSLRHHYHLDSVAAVNIIFHLECVLGVDIDVAILARVDSINDLKTAVARMLPAD